MIGGFIIIAGSVTALLGFRLAIYLSNAFYDLGLLNLGAATICGILVVVGAAMVKRGSADYHVWGGVIFAASAISLWGQGGFFIGAILGIIGAILILGERIPSERESP